LASRTKIRHHPGVFQLILPFQLELPFEAEAAAGARGPGGAANASRLARARRSRREPSRANLAFEFGRTLEEE
jgi:hypothetical protein